MLCKLCNKEKNLIKAHIVPKGFYDLNPYKKIYRCHAKYPKKSREGLWDPNILCQECDGLILGKLDDIGLKFFLSDEVLLEHIKNHAIQKFVYSVLWRASISSLQELSTVTLGEKHENALKVLFVSPGAIDIYNYPIRVAKFVGLPSNIEKYSALPVRLCRKNGINGYRLYFGIYLVDIKIDRRIDYSLFPKKLTLGYEDTVLAEDYPYEGSDEQRANQKMRATCPA